MEWIQWSEFDRVQWTELDDLRVESVGKCEVEWAEPCSKVTSCYMSSFMSKMIADVDSVVSLGEIKPKSASVQWGEPCYREKQLQLATRDMLQMTPRGGHPAIQRPALYCCMWVRKQSYQASGSMIKQSAAFTMKRPLSPMPRISSVSTWLDAKACRAPSFFRTQQSFFSIQGHTTSIS